MLAIKPDPNGQVLCCKCGWYGRIKDCNLKMNDLVRCPNCSKAVSKVIADDSFIVEK